MKLVDSRRLTGPNLITDGPSAIIDAEPGDFDAAEVISRWEMHARRMLEAVGWGDERVASHMFSRGIALVLTAPVDALYAATEVNEYAWECAAAELQGHAAPDFEENAKKLRDTIAEESNPRLIELHRAAAQRDVLFLPDDDFVSIGMCSGSLTFEVGAIPPVDEIEWDQVHNVPAAVVTGSNGKTTSVRVLASVAAAAGRTAGFSSTDGVYVGDQLVEAGDYSGPGGTRAVLRNKDVDIAILETARGGLLRRGLGTPRADAAIVTNIAADHIGEYGVGNLDEIAQAKLVVRKCLPDDGLLILNADDATLSRHMPEPNAGLALFALDRENQLLDRHLAGGAPGFYVSNGKFTREVNGAARQIVDVTAAPLTLGGAAGYHVSNLLGVIAMAGKLGFSDEEIARGITSFTPTPENSPGRTNLFEGHGVKVLVDFVHNPEGMRAIVETMLAIPAERRLIILGQAGDRDDDSIRAMVREVERLNPALVIVKEMTKYLRGREPGAIPAMIEEELRSFAKVPPIERTDSELEAAKRALEWSRPGDLLLLACHAQREAVIASVRQWAE